jgi:signal transduction histidine kinase
MNGNATEDRELTVRVKANGAGFLEVSVRDCGHGLTPNASRELFEPFYTTKPNGMGMGLAISRTIIEAHGGKSRAENNPDRGATFTFTLPADGG